MKFFAVLYLCLHLKYTILCWYLGQPHWEGESHYCLWWFLKWTTLYSQLRMGFMGWYFHDKWPPCVCQSSRSLSRQAAQRQGVTSPRISESPGHCLAIITAAAAFEQRQSSESIYHLLISPKGRHYTPKDLLCRLGNKQTPLTEKAAKKVFPFLCLSSGWSLKQANTSSVSKPEMVLSVCPSDLCYSSVMKEHQLGGPLLPHTTKTVTTEGITWKRNLGAHKSRVTELLYAYVCSQHELWPNALAWLNTVTQGTTVDLLLLHISALTELSAVVWTREKL